MGTFILVLILIIVFCLTIASLCSNREQYAHLEKDNGLEPEYKASAKYNGGFRDVSVKECPYVDVYMFKNKVRFIFRIVGNYIRHIDLESEELLEVRYMNERELTESISLGRVLVFGWIGLVAKKKKEINREFVVVKCIYEEKEIDVVLGGEELEKNKKCFNAIDNYIKENKFNRNKKEV